MKTRKFGMILWPGLEKNSLGVGKGMIKSLEYLLRTNLELIVWDLICLMPAILECSGCQE